MPKVKADVRIVNVVASVITKHGFDLAAIVKAFPHVEYRPEVFPGLCFRLEKPKTATLIFHSGRMVCTGATSVRQSKRAVRKVVRELKAKGIPVRGRPSIEIQNIVASVNLGGNVDIEKGVYVLERCMYEPEQFPGAIYRMADPKVVILIFNTGKLVVTGAKTEEQVYEAAERLQQRLEEEGVIFYE